MSDIIVQVKQSGKIEVVAPSFAMGQSRLSRLIDVDISSQSDGDVLVYDAGSNKYIFSTVNGGRF